ncbi:MAG TPA: response regulator transcription factor [Anaerolineaceae bacterium]
MKNNVRVLLADDHTLVRAGIHALLRSFEGVEVVAEAGDGLQAVMLTRAYIPDIVIMDIAMPGLNGLDATVRITKDFPGIRVLILSMYANEEYVLRALQAGIAGYILKDNTASELEDAIHAIMKDEIYLSPAVSKSVVADYLRRVGNRMAESAFPDRSINLLTTRQREVLQLIAEGYSTQEIASRLYISIKTVETHRANLMRRLGLHDLASLVRYAVRKGFVSLED